MQAAPVRRRRRSSTRATPVRRRRRSGGLSLGGVGSALGSGRLPLLVGAAALGYAHKEQWLAKIPLVGKAGPITSAGIIGWGVEEVLKFKLPKIAHDAVTAALVISAFNLGLSGGQTVVGNETAYPGGAVFYE